MASISISASLHAACSSHHVAKKQQPQMKPGRSLGSKQVNRPVALDVEGQKRIDTTEHTKKPDVRVDGLKGDENMSGQASYEMNFSVHRFSDDRWKNGTWDLNVFVKDGKMDWNDVIVAEARRRKFLELYPEAATNQEPVLFRSSIIPWWAWLRKIYLPEAELLNGRAAMVGFFMSYVVDALTGLDVVGQSGNILCKAGLFVAIISIVLFRRTEDFDQLRKLAVEATHYDKQWQASWQQDENLSVEDSAKNL